MNILLLSSIYPLDGPNNQGTKVCHFFAKEWLKMGHRVVAIHFQATYPAPFYWAAKLFQKKLAAKTGAIVYTHKEIENTIFEMDGVQVMRIPLFKALPHGKFSVKRLDNAQNSIINFLKELGFAPDLITSHFLNPQLEMLNRLKSLFRDAKTCLVFHLPAEYDIADKLYGSNLNKLLENVDILGFRNASLQNAFLKRYPYQKKTFVCYSGIPESYITTHNRHQFSGKLYRFIYVGGLVERKYPAQIIDALHEAYPDKNFEIEYVGNGQQSEPIREKAQQYGLGKQVKLIGRIDRSLILEHYDHADCMVMISRGEAYGLVYLEAMARGCITIASKDEGMDGVIKHGQNGFLCTAGNAQELAELIKTINALSESEKLRLSENAIQTAKQLTDYNAAELYLKDLCN